MTSVLANHIKEMLIDLKFIDKKAGLVQTMERLEPTIIEDTFAVSRFPASVDVSFEDCGRKNCFTDLVPNSNLKGVLYFEDLGTIPQGSRGSDFSYKSVLRLIVWINNQKIQGKDCQSIRHRLITYIRSKLEPNVFNIPEQSIKKVSITTGRIIENDYEIFKRYTYPRDVIKYLMHPYEAFSIDLVVEYTMSSNCLPELILKEDKC